jgi:ATP-binding cassette subfamily C protein CydC
MNALVRVIKLSAAARGRLVLAWFLGTLAAASAIGLMAASAWLISRAAQQPPVLYLMVAIVSVRAFAILRATSRYAERLVAHDAAFRVLGEARARVFQRLEQLAPAGLPAFRSGDLLSRMVADVDTLQDLWVRLLLPYGVAALAGTGSVVLIGALLPEAAIVLALSLAVVALVAPWVAAKTARHAEASSAPLQGALSTATLDLLRGAPELVACGAADRQLAKVARVDEQLVQANARSAAGVGIGAAIATAAAGAAILAGLAFGVPAVRSGAMSGVLLAVVVLTPLAVHEVFSGLSGAAQQLPRVRAAAERVLDVLDALPPVTEPIDPRAVPELPNGFQLAGVVAGWPHGPDVLAGASASIAHGDRVALIGPSGAGKSTLAAVLLKFLCARSGSVRLLGQDGQEADLVDLDGDDIRRVVGLCAQNAYLFNTTIGENIKLARPDATDEQIADALRGARLLGWVDRLPDGLDTRVGEQGAAVSAGQQQRIALARILLAGFDVLVLDEPTEHLDEPTAAALMADMVTETAGQTVLLMTHRTKDLSGFDRTLMLADGRFTVVEQLVAK